VAGRGELQHPQIGKRYRSQNQNQRKECRKGPANLENIARKSEKGGEAAELLKKYGKGIKKEGGRERGSFGWPRKKGPGAHRCAGGGGDRRGWLLGFDEAGEK